MNVCVRLLVWVCNELFRMLDDLDRYEEEDVSDPMELFESWREERPYNPVRFALWVRWVSNRFVVDKGNELKTM